MAGAKKIQNNVPEQKINGVQRFKEVQKIVCAGRVIRQEDSSSSDSVVSSGAFPPKEKHMHDLTLRLFPTTGGKGKGLARSTRLVPNTLVLNEQAPPPPRDFLTLGMSSSLPVRTEAATGGQIQQHRPGQDQHTQLQKAARPDSQRRRDLVPNHYRMMMEQQKKNHEQAIRQQQVMMAAPPPPLPPVHQQVTMAAPPPPVQQQAVMAAPPPPPVQQQMMMTITTQPPPQQHNRAFAPAAPLMLSQQQMMMIPPTQQHYLHQSTAGRRSNKMNNLAASVASGGTLPALYQALSIAEAQKDHLNVVPVHRGTKRPVVPKPENAPHFISPPGSSKMAPAMESNGSCESAKKKQKETRNKAIQERLEILGQRPGVSLKENEGSNERVEGFLYQLGNGDVSILCSCHGKLLTPAEFVEHAGSANGQNPMKHIVISSNPIPPPPPY